MESIIPFLWFDGEAEEAAKFYTSVFQNSKILNIAYYGKVGAKHSGRPVGSVMSVEFELAGREFVAFNGGGRFTRTPAVSFYVNCDTQEEVDFLWNRLSGNGSFEQRGWLTDKFGVYWQIVPEIIGEMLADQDTSKSGRVMEAMLKMKKFDIEALKRAYEGKDEE
ncbi:MAG: VOC family protein [Alphaproteobacteria bacterium]|nr:VOC family protein [Alphaproteobacteria bacterium]